MKIALYCPNKPLAHPHPSGDLTIARSIHRVLNQQGHDCREAVVFRSRWFWKTWGGMAKAFQAARNARTFTRVFLPDLWLTYHPYYKSPDVLGPWMSALHRIPYVLFQPMYGTKHRKNKVSRPGFYLNRMALKRADLLITNNLLDVPSLERAVSPSQITYLPPGIFPEAFHRDFEAGEAVRSCCNFPPGLPVLLTVARFRADVKLKSLLFLFEALAHLNRRLREFHLLVVGDGPAEAAVRKAAGETLPGRVTFTGGVPREELYRYYSAADVFVFPGIGESLGMVYLEAQACGLPVVALNNGGISQVVQDEVTGILVRDSSPECMAEAIETLLNDAGRIQRMSRAARRFIETERNLWINFHRLETLLAGLVERSKASR